MPRRPPPTDEELLSWAKGSAGIVDGLIAIRRLRYLLAEREHHLVGKARGIGLPWHVIGMWLGVSPQGVHKRWAKRIAEEEDEELDEPSAFSPGSPVPSTE